MIVPLPDRSSSQSHDSKNPRHHLLKSNTVKCYSNLQWYLDSARWSTRCSHWQLMWVVTTMAGSGVGSVLQVEDILQHQLQAVTGCCSFSQVICSPQECEGGFECLYAVELSSRCCLLGSIGLTSAGALLLQRPEQVTQCTLCDGGTVKKALCESCLMQKALNKQSRLPRGWTWWVSEVYQ